MLDVKDLRLQIGLKQFEAAKLLGITNDYLSMVETGKRNCSFKLINSMSKVYKVPPEQIFLILNRTYCSVWLYQQ